VEKSVLINGIQYFTIAGVAKKTNVTVDAVYKAINRKLLSSERIEGHHYITPAAFQKYLNHKATRGRPRQKAET